MDRVSFCTTFASPADYEEEPVRDGRWRAQHGWALALEPGMASTKKAEVFCLSGVRTSTFVHGTQKAVPGLVLRRI